MPNHTVKTLHSFPKDFMLKYECTKCGRSGQSRIETLIETFGPDVGLPDLRVMIAEKAGCPNVVKKDREKCDLLYTNLPSN